VAVAPPAVGGDQQLPGSGKSATAHLLPPSADAVDGELGGVVVDPHAHPALIVENIVDTVGNCFPQCLIQEVMNTNFLGFATGTPLASGVLEIAYQLLLLGVYRDCRLTTIVERSHRSVDVLELGVAVGMRGSFPRLAIGL